MYTIYDWIPNRVLFVVAVLVVLSQTFAILTAAPFSKPSNWPNCPAQYTKHSDHWNETTLSTAKKNKDSAREIKRFATKKSEKQNNTIHAMMTRSCTHIRHRVDDMLVLYIVCCMHELCKRCVCVCKYSTVHMRRWYLCALCLVGPHLRRMRRHCTPGWLGWCGSIMVIHDRIIARFVSLLLSPGFWNVPTTSGIQTQFFHTIHRRRRRRCRCRFSCRTYNKCIISPCLARLRTNSGRICFRSQRSQTKRTKDWILHQIRSRPSCRRIISALFVLCSHAVR